MKIATPIKLILFSSLLQIHTFVAKSVYSIGSNITISTLTFTPRPKDNGRLLACQAKIKDLPESGLDSKRKLVVYCKYNYHTERKCCEKETVRSIHLSLQISRIEKMISIFL